MRKSLVRKVFAPLAAGGALALIVFGAPAASANTLSYSSVVKCVYPNGTYTWIQWVLSNTGTARHVEEVFINYDVRSNMVLSGGKSVNSASVAEINGGGTYGTGYHRDGTWNWGGTNDLSTTEMPYVGNTIPVTIHWHLRQVTTNSECVYGHSM